MTSTIRTATILVTYQFDEERYDGNHRPDYYASETALRRGLEIRPTYAGQIAMGMTVHEPYQILSIMEVNDHAEFTTGAEAGCDHDDQPALQPGVDESGSPPREGGDPDEAGAPDRGFQGSARDPNYGD